MPDIRHSFCFSLLCNCCHNKHNKLKQKRSQNDDWLRRFESSYFVICLIQREVILDNFVNERFGTAISFVQ